MPNHVTNKLTIHAPHHITESILKAIGTDHSAQPRTAYDGSLIYKNKNGGDEEVGYLSASGKFLIKNFKLQRETNCDAVPSGWEPKIEPEYRQVIDFAKIVPPPDSPAYRDEPTQAAARNSPDWWHSWNCDNWGTKWGAYNGRQEGNVLYFDTAWSPPLPVIQKLSEQHPNTKFTLHYVDEGWGFAGSTEFLGGVQVAECTLACSKYNDLFCDLCAELKGYDPRHDDDDESDI
jgi:hypothetical protein